MTAERITVAHVVTWIYKARLPRRLRETAMAIVLALPWAPLDQGMTVLDSAQDARYPDRGVTISYLAQLCSSAPRSDSQRPSTDTGRTQHRALHGGKRGTAKDGTLRDDGLPTLTGLGLVQIEARKGRASQYKIDVAGFRKLAAGAQRKVVEHVEAREARNGDLKPGAKGREGPWAPGLPDHEAILEGDEQETRTNDQGDKVDGRGIPLWVPELDEDTGSRAEFWMAIRTIADELWPNHEGRDAARRGGELSAPLLKLWRSVEWRGSHKRPSWAHLTTDVVRYLRIVRECRNVAILGGFRGYRKGTNGQWAQRATDWTTPENAIPRKLLTPSRLAQVLAIGDVHDEQGACGCHHERLPLPDADAADEPLAFQFEQILATIDGPATLETDAAGLWQRSLARLTDVYGRDAAIWFGALKAVRIDEGMLVVRLPNHYYHEWISTNTDIAAHVEHGIVFVTGQPQQG